jgi:ATP-binding cassette, subfamily B, bacterial
VRGTSDLRLYVRLLRQARPHRLHLLTLLGVSLLATPFALLAPLPLKIAVDSVVGSDPLPGFLDPLLPGFVGGSELGVLIFAVSLLVLVSMLTELQYVALEVLGASTGEKLLLNLRAALFRKLQRLSFGYHDSVGTADSAYRIEYDATAMRDLAVVGLTPFVTAGVTLVAMVAVTARIDWQLALVALVVIPVLFVLTQIYRRRVRVQWQETKRLESAALSVVQEVLTSLRVVKAFGQEEREHQRFVSRSHERMRARIRLAFLEGLFGVLLGLTTAIGTGVVLFVGVRHVQAGTLSLGSLLLVMGYLVAIYAPLKSLSHSLVTIQASLAGAERAFAILDEEPDVPEKAHPLRIKRATGRIAFHDVAFGYGDGPPVLSGVSFDLPRGTRLGISGPTGSGKTTLASLVTRFYDPTEGAVTLDGVDLREYKLADLRNQFAIVLQEPVLFSTSIAENIAYANPRASINEIAAAAEAANAYDFVSRLPRGFATPVGERGLRLSGGERQRIALARAFLKDAPILILDEPTSSVDVEAEAAIVESMERLMAGRTTLMIAHRLSTLEACDAWVEVRGGSVVQMTAAPTGRAHVATDLVAG